MLAFFTFLFLLLSIYIYIFFMFTMKTILTTIIYPFCLLLSTSFHSYMNHSQTQTRLARDKQAADIQQLFHNLQQLGQANQAASKVCCFSLTGKTICFVVCSLLCVVFLFEFLGFFFFFQSLLFIIGPPFSGHC